jgi:ankyrin repeat protein
MANQLKTAIEQRQNSQLHELLRRHPASANIPDDDGEFPLHYAASFGNVEAAKLLIAAGADVNARERSYHTPLSWAMIEGAHKVAHLLIENGATYDLWAAAAFGDLPHVQTFFEPNGTLKPNASVHGVSRKGPDGHILPKPPASDEGVLSDAFFIACVNGQTETASFIRDRAIATNHRVDVFGLPLHEACKYGHHDTVQYLLDLGADRTALDRHGKTPRDLALAAGHPSIADLI